MTLVYRLVVSVLAALVIVCDAEAQVAPFTALDPQPPAGEIAAAGRLSMSTAQPIRVRDALRLLVRGTRFNIVLDPAVNGTFAGDLTDVTLRQALEAVLRPRRLGYAIEGSVIKVFPRRTESRVFTVDFVNVRRSWQRTLQQGDGASLSTLAGSDAFDEMQKSVDALLSPEGRAHVDRHAGLIAAADYPEQLDRIATYVETLRSRSLRQVRLRAEVVDAAATPTVTLPDVVTINNEAAVFRTTEPAGATFALTIVPQVESDDVIQLNVSPSWSDRAAARSGASDVVSRVRNGGTLVVPLAEGLTVQVTATIVADGR